MNNELKKDPQTPEVESTELSGKDLEEVDGGAIEWTYTKQKPAGTAGGNTTK